MREFNIPLVDIGAFADGDKYARASLARLVDDTFCESGFMVVSGHGIPQPVIANAKAQARAFFGESTEVKAAAEVDGDPSRGYFPPDSISSARYENKDTPPDLMEGFAFGPSRPPVWAPDAKGYAVNGENVWPNSPAAFRPAAEDYYREVEALAGELLKLFALALRLDEDYFLPYYTPYGGIVRMNLYRRQTTAPLPGQLRIGAHTDIGGFTILSADSTSNGLQVQDRDGNWHDVDAIDNTFIINLGELMETWTNGRWRATRHRVVNPRTINENVDRLSIPFFANPDPSITCECIPTCLNAGETPRHEPFVAGEFRLRRLAQQQDLADAGAK